MNALRVLVAVSVLTAVPALASPGLELEVGAGARAITTPLPSLTARVGLDVLDWFTPSVRLVTVSPLGSAAPSFAVLGELRAHSSGRFQLNAGLGMGVATATFMNGVTSASVEKVAPYFTGDVGLRVVLGAFWVGANVGGSPSPNTWTATLNVGVLAFGG